MTSPFIRFATGDKSPEEYERLGYMYEITIPVSLSREQLLELKNKLLPFLQPPTYPEKENGNA